MADNSVYNISYSNRSLSDALIIKEYLLYKFTQKELNSFYHMLGVFESIVSKFPKLYPQSSKNKRLRRAVLSKQLSIFYTISKDSILIVAILDNRMSTTKWP
jgi:hypothetical protein